MRSTLQYLILAVSLSSVAGCTVGPNYAAPHTNLSTGWSELKSFPNQQAAVVTTQPVELSRWWTLFDDSTLNSLEERAAAANLDLKIARARVLEARSLRGIVSADQYPNLNVDGQAVRQRTSKNGLVPPTGETFNLFDAGFDASWELDVFGGIRRNVEAADADVGAAVENRADVLVSLVAEVARNYVELRGFQRRAVIARLNVEAQRQTVEITQKRIQAGTATDLDLARAKALVTSTQSQVPLLESQAAQSIHRLSVLIAREPGELIAELSVMAPIPPPPPEVPVGLPSDLLRRRPDVGRAEREFAAATARVGVATADLYPRFSLTGSFGLEGAKAKNLLEASSNFWSVGPAVRWPIFDAGRIRSNIAVQDARTRQAAARYDAAVLNALKDVEDALVAYTKDRERRQTLAETVQHDQNAVDLALALYNKAGLITFLDVLDAQRELYTAQDAQAQGDRDVSADIVALSKALGGGWDPAHPEASPLAQLQGVNP